MFSYTALIVLFSMWCCLSGSVPLRTDFVSQQFCVMDMNPVDVYFWVSHLARRQKNKGDLWGNIIVITNLYILSFHVRQAHNANIRRWVFLNRKKSSREVNKLLAYWYISTLWIHIWHVDKQWYMIFGCWKQVFWLYYPQHIILECFLFALSVLANIPIY